MKTRIALAVLGMLLGTMACQKEELTEPASMDPTMRHAPEALADINLIGPEWSLISLGTTSLNSHEGPWMLIAPEGTVSGSTGCNTFSGDVRVGTNALLFGRLLSTRIHCPATAALETDFVDALRTTNNYRMDAGSLVLLIGNHELARFEPR